jgi:hypothetical protein
VLLPHIRRYVEVLGVKLFLKENCRSTVALVTQLCRCALLPGFLHAPSECPHGLAVHRGIVQLRQTTLLVGDCDRLRLALPLSAADVLTEYHPERQRRTQRPRRAADHVKLDASQTTVSRYN